MSTDHRGRMVGEAYNCVPCYRTEFPDFRIDHYCPLLDIAIIANIGLVESDIGEKHDIFCESGCGVDAGSWADPAGWISSPHYTITICAFQAVKKPLHNIPDH